MGAVDHFWVLSGHLKAWWDYPTCLCTHALQGSMSARVSESTWREINWLCLLKQRLVLLFGDLASDINSFSMSLPELLDSQGWNWTMAVMQTRFILFSGTPKSEEFKITHGRMWFQLIDISKLRFLPCHIQTCVSFSYSLSIWSVLVSKWSKLSNCPEIVMVRSAGKKKARKRHGGVEVWTLQKWQTPKKNGN